MMPPETAGQGATTGKCLPRYARASKSSHRGGKCVTSCGLNFSKKKAEDNAEEKEVEDPKTPLHCPCPLMKYFTLQIVL
jgi:hypothetical protein